jgi:hypothetical protein
MDVFLSCFHSDRPRIESVIRALKQRGMRADADVFDDIDPMIPETDLRGSIRNAIEAASTSLFYGPKPPLLPLMRTMKSAWPARWGTDGSGCA